MSLPRCIPFDFRGNGKKTLHQKTQKYKEKEEEEMETELQWSSAVLLIQFYAFKTSDD